MFEYLAIYCPVLLVLTPRLRVSATEQITSREQSSVLITARSCTDQQMLVLAAPHAPSVQWLMSKLTANTKINCKNPLNSNTVRVQIPRSGTLLANRKQNLTLTARLLGGDTRMLTKHPIYFALKDGGQARAELELAPKLTELRYSPNT